MGIAEMRVLNLTGHPSVRPGTVRWSYGYSYARRRQMDTENNVRFGHLGLQTRYWQLGITFLPSTEAHCYAELAVSSPAVAATIANTHFT